MEMARKSNPKGQPRPLQGWQQIAAFLGQPLSVVQRWAREGMAVERKGRNVFAQADALNSWLGGESGGESLQIASEETDLGSELKRGLALVKQERRKKAA